MAQKIKAYTGSEPYIFVSYAHKDSKTVYSIIENLTGKGYRIWYDEGIPAVADYGGEIYNRIMNCGVFIIFKSDASVASDDVEKELLHAVSFKKKIVQIAIDPDAKYPASVAYHIPASRQYIDINVSPAEFYEKLEAQLAVCNRKNAAASSDDPVTNIATKLFYTAKNYYNGVGVSEDKSKAAELYQKAADLGNAKAMNNLGIMYQTGECVPQDDEKAFELYQIAADLGNETAMINLGIMYENGDGVSQDYEKAIELYKKAADLGNASAMNYLGIMYENGDGVSQDYEKAIELYQKASDLGNADAMTNLGVMYENGDGVYQDYEKAVELFQNAADLGNARAMNNLGIMYENGEGVYQDYEMAYELYQKAADLGDADAMNNLGIMYENGEGMPRDKKKAAQLYWDAAELGSEEGEQNYKRLNSGLRRLFGW